MVELGGEDFSRPGPVAQRGLGQQELERPAGLVEDLLAPEAGRHRWPDVGRVDSEGQDPARVRGGLQQAGDDSRLEVPQGAGSGLQAAHVLLDGRQAVAQPGPQRRHLVDGGLGHAEDDLLALSADLGGVSPGQDLGERGNGLAPLDAGDRGLAKAGGPGDLAAGQSRERTDPPQLGAEPGELRPGATGLSFAHAAALRRCAR